MARLRRILAVSPDEVINEKVTLVDQGVDSLMAVEVRSWFLKELDVDIPVLKILGGSSPLDLLTEALKLLSPSIADLSALEPGQAAQAAVPKAAPKAAPKGTPSPAVNPIIEIKRPDNTSNGRPSSSSGDSSADESPSRRTPTSTAANTAGYNTPMTSSALSTASIQLASEKNARSSYFSTQRPDESTSPMSFGQTGFWFLNEYLAEKKAFNMAVMLKLTGPVRIRSLEDALHLVGNRHEILRTRFFWSGEGEDRKPMQGIRALSELKLTTKRIRSEAEAKAELQAVHDEIWDLSSGDAMKVSLLSQSDQKHYLVLGMHHIFMDGYSFSVFFKDLDAAYNRKTLSPLPSESQYRHFAMQQIKAYESGAFGKTIEHYRNTLPQEFKSKPIELFPFARSATRQPMLTYSQQEASVRLEAGVAAKIRQLARQNSSTSFHVYLSALRVLLFSLLPSTDDICIGIADTNRTDKNYMNSIGFFLNLLPLHFRRGEAGTSLASIIKSARDTAYGALQHSQLPLDVLLKELNVSRSNAYTPIFQVFLDYRQVVQERPSCVGCKLDGEDWCNASTGYDVALEITENANTDTLLSLHLQDSLYSQESTQLLLRSFVNVLKHMVDAPSRAVVGDLPTWPRNDVAAALTAGQGEISDSTGGVEEIADKTIEQSLESKWNQPTVAHRIEQLTRAHPEKTAIRDGNGNTLTYAQMAARVDTIRKALEGSSVRKGDIVGVFQEPCADWICSMLAIFRAGAVYVPLDLRSSTARLASIVRVSRPSTILTDNTTADKISLIGATNVTVLSVSGLMPAKTSYPNRAEPNAQAVILFTSGSTGEPKGLNMTHVNMVTSAEASSRTFVTSSGGNLVVLQQSPYSFDFSLDQTFAALTNGGCLCVVPACYRGDPVEISRIMAAEKVTYTSGTPSEFAMWLRYGASNLSQCRSWTHVFSGGEAMSHGLAREFATLNLPHLHVSTGYGPAETTMFSTKIELNYTSPDLPNPLPAGHMLAGYSVCIVDANVQPVPLGVSGEIVIGGRCVVDGYFGNPESTKQKFLQDSFFGTPGKVYRSGDRGRLLADGTLFVEGRLEGDTQVKIRGFRVEITEIENLLLKRAAGAFSHAVVTLRGSGDAKYLAAHVVFSPEYPEEHRPAMLESLRHGLPLPPYMRPSAVVPLSDIPRTAHSKVDRKAIQALPLPSTQEATQTSENLSETERKLGDVWRQVLPLHPGPLHLDSDFFLVGGNSILLVRLQSLLRDAFSATPKLFTLMGASTLGEMAATITANGSTAIDWDTETSLPESLKQIVPTKRTTNAGTKTMLLTGSSGYLGRHLLAQLAEDPNLKQIICLVRQADSGSLTLGTNNKITFVQADISQHNLGLSDGGFSALVEKADVVVHCAANRSFWDRYEVLRHDNLNSVKELARLAAHHAIPLHFISSGAVKTYVDAGTTPPQDGSDGYVAAKWAAETLLHKAAVALNIPVYIHRPTGLPKATSGDNATEHAVLTDELLKIAGKLGTRPSFDTVKGTVDVVPVHDVVQAIHRSAYFSIGADLHGKNGGLVEILHHEAVLRVSVDEFAALMQEQKGLSSLPSVPILEWFGQTKKAGFSFFMAAQDLSMGTAGAELVSRR